MIHKNVIIDFSQKESAPQIDDTACIHEQAAVIGNVFIGKKVFVSPFASVRGDEGQPIFIGDEANIQDGVIIHGLETEHNGSPVEANLVTNQETGGQYSVYVGRRVSLAHQSHIHGPAYINDDSFIGMKVLVLKASVGKNCVVEPGAILMGVNVPDKRYVSAGTVLTNQKDADNLPDITEDYPFKNLNKGVVKVNTALAEKYKKAGFGA